MSRGWNADGEWVIESEENGFLEVDKSLEVGPAGAADEDDDSPLDRVMDQAIGLGSSGGGAAPAAKDKEWSAMSAEEREAVETLGWTARSWDAGDAAPFETEWANLMSAEQAAATSLGFSRSSFAQPAAPAAPAPAPEPPPQRLSIGDVLASIEAEPASTDAAQQEPPMSPATALQRSMMEGETSLAEAHSPRRGRAAAETRRKPRPQPEPEPEPYLPARAASLPEPQPQPRPQPEPEPTPEPHPEPEPQPLRYRVLVTAPVTYGLHPTSAEAGTVYAGLEITALETKALPDSGMPRVRCSQGWVSECERDGTILLEKVGDEAYQEMIIMELAETWATMDRALADENRVQALFSAQRSRGKTPPSSEEHAEQEEQEQEQEQELPELVTVPRPAPVDDVEQQLQQSQHALTDALLSTQQAGASEGSALSPLPDGKLQRQCDGAAFTLVWCTGNLDVLLAAVLGAAAGLFFWTRRWALVAPDPLGLVPVLAVAVVLLVAAMLGCCAARRPDPSATGCCTRLRLKLQKCLLCIGTLLSLGIGAVFIVLGAFVLSRVFGEGADAADGGRVWLQRIVDPCAHLTAADFSERPSWCDPSCTAASSSGADGDPCGNPLDQGLMLLITAKPLATGVVLCVLGALQLARVVGGCLIRRHLTRHIDDDLSPSRSARRRHRQREMSMPT